MQKPIICIGAALIDELYHASQKMLPATANDAVVTKTAGGVGRNIAHQLALLSVPVQLISVFGDDSDGEWLKKVCTDAGVLLDAAITRKGHSGKYTGILDQDGSLYTALITDAAIELITPEHLAAHQGLLSTAAYLLTDANIQVETAEWLLDFSKQTGIPFIIEPGSVPPAKKYKDANLEGLYMITPNEDELPVLCSENNSLTQMQVEELLNKGVKNIWLHNGKHGSVLYSQGKTLSLHAPDIEVVDCTGAGDGSLTGFLLGKYLGWEDFECIKLAHTMSGEILQVNGAIAMHLNQTMLLDRVKNYY